jgi:septin family protein
MSEFELMKIYEDSGLEEVNVEAVENYMKQVEDEMAKDYKILHNALILIGELRNIMENFLDCFRREAEMTEETRPGSKKCLNMFGELKSKLNFLEMEFEMLSRDSKEENYMEAYIERHIKHWKKVFDACERDLQTHGFL